MNKSKMDSKFMLTVTDLAKQSGTTSHAVRYYSRMGLLNPERHPVNGYRQYQPGDIAKLKFIRQAKRLGYTLNEIKEIIHHSEDGKSPCPRVRDILLQRIKENREKLDELEALQVRMEKALDEWKTMRDGMPDGDSVCYLIESFVDGE